MIVADLGGTAALRERLAGQGLRLRTGSFVTEIRSTLDRVAEGIALYYAQHPLEHDDAFVDFHVRVRKPPGLRHWIRPQVVFEFDGMAPFLPLAADQAYPMLEWGLNWCVHSNCHQYLVIHSAVLERGGRALLLPAPAGSGKSTLCAALACRGWRLLSDELAILDVASGLVQPLARPVSLKNASIDVMRRFEPTAVIGTPVRDTLKGTVSYMRPPADAVQRAAEPALPTWIVMPRYIPAAPARLEPLPKARTFMRIADNAFNPTLHGRAGFEALAQLVDRAACMEFSYGHLDEAMQVFDRLADEA